MATKPAFSDVPAWPDASSAPAPRGHNRLPLEELIPLEFREALLSERPDFLTRFEQLIAAADRAKASDDETLGKCGDLVNAYRQCGDHVTKIHKAVKAPHREAGLLIDAEKNALTDRLNEAIARVRSVGDAFVADRDAKIKAERDRIAAEQRAAAERSAAAERERERAEREAAQEIANAANEQDRQAAQARADEAARAAEVAMSAAALAPAAPEKPEPVRSDEGATVSSKQEWKSEVTDYTVAFMAVEDNPKVREAIDKAIAGLVRAGKRQVEGVRIWPVAKANFR